jgi:hypothetical protein
MNKVSFEVEHVIVTEPSSNSKLHLVTQQTLNITADLKCLASALQDQ